MNNLAIVVDLLRNLQWNQYNCTLCYAGKDFTLSTFYDGALGIVTNMSAFVHIYLVDLQKKKY